MRPRPTKRISIKPVTLWSPIETTDIEWNFEKFLIDENGFPIRRFSEITFPFTFEKDIKEAIESCAENLHGVSNVFEY